VNENPNKLLYFFDEARFGTHSKLGHGWFTKGSRTQVNVKLGFRNFYLYSALNPITGEDFTLMLPSVNTDCMNIYLEEMSEYLCGTEAFIVMDQAGWHKSKGLKIPRNITILYLPPYSPELNPVERFWKYIKQHTIKNKIYDNLKDLEDVIANFLNSLTSSAIKSLCTLSYL
jgi:hypothetical protein